MIYNTDCLKFLETIPDSSYDVCISSPPYNLGVRYSEYKDTRSDYIEWMKDVWYEVCRVLKPDGHLFLNFHQIHLQVYQRLLYHLLNIFVTHLSVF